RTVIFGGEALSPGKLAKWKKKYSETKLINMYGITETTVHVTYKEITEEEIILNVSNIGRPIPTLTTYVLDNWMKLVPVGVAGELYVGGEGVCRGYLNREELTSQKFVDNPYLSGERLYKSGDLVKRLPNGELEYLGRKDFQVKIRGFRIELGEIESKLSAIESIRDAVVVARTDETGAGYLCAYYTGTVEFPVSELRNGLLKELPEYMAPAYFFYLEKIPMTLNGKINKKALPLPGGEIITGVEYVAPGNDVEKKLALIWRELLGVKKVGILDNFFELGGHSLKAMAMISKMSAEGFTITVNDVFFKSNI
ncbi:MAG: non-ribosomal peptide synthetase, partial [bacterium]|nr:non-ribosomal peptide synthetase [bacterium]